MTGASTTVYGRNVGATKETGEPNHAGNAGGKSVWYSWTAPHSATVEVTTAKSVTYSGLSWNTLLAVYTGSSVSSLTLIASNDDSGIGGDGSTTSRLFFNAAAGTTYQIAVDSLDGAAGSVVLAGGYQSSVSVPDPAAVNPINAVRLNAAGHYTGTLGGQSCLPDDRDSHQPWRSRRRS